MTKSTKYQDLIRNRISCRTYDSMPISLESIAKMEEKIAELNQEAKTEVRFAIVSSLSDDRNAKAKLGTYGVMSGAHTFIEAIQDIETGDPLELGYLFEKAVLFATELGLSTCWLGGTFNRGNFEKSLTLTNNETIPIVSPIGYAKDKRSLLDSTMRFGAGSNHRKPWNELFFENDSKTPLTKENAGKYEVALEMVRLGPSASNKQPWRLMKTGDDFHFFIQRNQGYGDMIRYDLQLNDLGIAKCHFELTLQESGIQGTWFTLDPQPKIEGWVYGCTYKCRV
ncbi:MAG: nitroreductase [Erysipelotrichaceae bacterium]|nr:MAG: hypothetical protein FD179_594 [Erysipelotrichaceae bacterium]TXT17713.1 MAG: nitroreductase [Erysipelotrichaceae bacterium]